MRRVADRVELAGGDALVVLARALSGLSSGAPVLLEREGRPVAALVTLEDLAWMEELENRLDVESYREAKQAMAEHGAHFRSFEEVCRELEL